MTTEHDDTTTQDTTTAAEETEATAKKSKKVTTSTRRAKPEAESQATAASATDEEGNAANDDAEKNAERLAEEQRVNTLASKPLALKMARVMADVRHVPKNGRNDFHNYNYIMESDLVDRLRGKLAEQGVAVFPSIREHVVTQTKDNRNKVQYLATVTLDVTFIDGDSGDQFTTTWVGQGVDQGDKSYYKAYTGAFKYALLKTFLVTAEEDSEPAASVPAPRSTHGQGGGRRRAGGYR